MKDLRNRTVVKIVKRNNRNTNESKIHLHTETVITKSLTVSAKCTIH